MEQQESDVDCRTAMIAEQGVVGETEEKEGPGRSQLPTVWAHITQYDTCEI